LRKPKNMN